MGKLLTWVTCGLLLLACGGDEPRSSLRSDAGAGGDEATGGDGGSGSESGGGSGVCEPLTECPVNACDATSDGCHGGLSCPQRACALDINGQPWSDWGACIDGLCVCTPIDTNSEAVAMCEAAGYPEATHYAASCGAPIPQPHAPPECAYVGALIPNEVGAWCCER